MSANSKNLWFNIGAVALALVIVVGIIVLKQAQSPRKAGEIGLVPPGSLKAANERDMTAPAKRSWQEPVASAPTNEPDESTPREESPAEPPTASPEGQPGIGQNPPLPQPDPLESEEVRKHREARRQYIQVVIEEREFLHNQANALREMYSARPDAINLRRAITREQLEQLQAQMNAFKKRKPQLESLYSDGDVHESERLLSESFAFILEKLQGAMQNPEQGTVDVEKFLDETFTNLDLVLQWTAEGPLFE